MAWPLNRYTLEPTRKPGSIQPTAANMKAEVAAQDSEPIAVEKLQLREGGRSGFRAPSSQQASGPVAGVVSALGRRAKPVIDRFPKHRTVSAED